MEDKDEHFLDEAEEKDLPVVEEKLEEEPKEQAFYKKVLWKGILETFYCNQCGFCDADEDNMILHVVKHFPETEQEMLMNQLIKNKEK